MRNKSGWRIEYRPFPGKTVYRYWDEVFDTEAKAYEHATSANSKSQEGGYDVFPDFRIVHVKETTE